MTNQIYRIPLQFLSVVAVVAAFSVAPASAQNQPSGTAPPSTATPPSGSGSMEGTEHGNMPMEGMEHGKMPMEGMGHGDMPKQGMAHGDQMKKMEQQKEKRGHMMGPMGKTPSSDTSNAPPTDAPAAPK